MSWGCRPSVRTQRARQHPVGHAHNTNPLLQIITCGIPGKSSGTVVQDLVDMENKKSRMGAGTVS